MEATDQTLSVVRAYHRAWTGGELRGGRSPSCPQPPGRGPVNDYPTTDSFAEALLAFGPLVTGVDLLSELAEGSEAMLLYDMDIDGLGKMRIAEHFTVADGRITRLRQIHDTAAIRVLHSNGAPEERWTTRLEADSPVATSAPEGPFVDEC
jgi:hypothetical protein